MQRGTNPADHHESPMIQSLEPLRLLGAMAAIGSLAACSGQKQTPASGPAPSPYEPASAPAAAPAANSAAASTPDWFTVDSAAHVVTLSIEVTAPPGSPSALLNGYRTGEAQISVPLGWTVRWDWRSADSTAPHSLVVMVEREKIPLEGGRPSLSNAMTRMVNDGLRPGEPDQTTFVAEEAGWYWMLCGVPVHAINGEWISLKIDREAKLPSVVVRNVSGER